MNIKYPTWIPYPSSWLRSLVPLILFPCMWVGFGFLDRIIFMISFLVGIGIIPLFVMGPSILITYLHHQAFGKGSKPVPISVSIWEGLYAFQVFIMTVLILLLTIGYTAAFFGPHTAQFSEWQTYSHLFDDYSYSSDVEGAIALAMILYIWFVAASLYQIEYLARRAMRQFKRDYKKLSDTKA